MALSAAIFRRGGPKKELFSDSGAISAEHGNAQDAADREQLQQELAQVLDVLQAPKAGRDLSAAIWRPAVGAAELVLSRRSTGQSMGFTYGRRHYLHIEEAAFLVDRADMLLFTQRGGAVSGQDGEEDEEDGAGASAGGAGNSSADGRPRHQLLSMQEVFELMELCGVSMDRYCVYASLMRSGYLVMRYPSRWVLDPGQRPGHVWGHGAWAHCAGMQQTSAGASHAVQLEVSLLPEAASHSIGVAVAATAASSASGGIAACQRQLSPRSALMCALHQAARPGHEAAALDTQPAAATGPAAQAGASSSHAMQTHAPPPDPANPQGIKRKQAEAQGLDTASANGLRSGDAADMHVSKAPCVDSSRPVPTQPHIMDPGPIPATGSGPIDLPGHTEQTRQPATGLRGWWPAQPALHQDVPTDGPHRVGVGQGPRLQGWGMPVDEGAGAALRAQFPRLRPLRLLREAAATEHVVGFRSVCGSAACVQSAGSPQAELAVQCVTSSSGHLVFDVYKPGCKVARARRSFPTPSAHIAISSARPPTLQELWLADEQAVGAPVKWVAVTDGVTTMYEIGVADLLPLL